MNQSLLQEGEKKVRPRAKPKVSLSSQHTELILESPYYNIQEWKYNKKCIYWNIQNDISRGQLSLKEFDLLTLNKKDYKTSEHFIYRV